MGLDRQLTGRVCLLRQRDKAGENGLTLIELLVTVVILGVAFVVLVGGLGTAILASDVQKRQVTADAVLRSAATEVRSAEYVGCTAAATYDVPDLDETGYEATATVVGWWDRDTNQFSSSPCADPVVDEGLQLVELTVTASARTVTESMQIVKRDPNP